MTDARDQKSAKGQPVFTPLAYSAFKMEVLRWADAWGDRGIFATPFTPGGTLAALSMAGLVERVAPPQGDRIGGTRYRITDLGRRVLSETRGPSKSLQS